MRMKKSLLGLILICCFACKNGNQHKEVVLTEEQKYENWVKEHVDSVKINELCGFYNYKTSEFDEPGLTWVSPKDIHTISERNGVTCYFQLKDKIACNFRLKINYLSDDWLFIKAYKFSIDGKVYTLVTDDVKRNAIDGHICEFSDLECVDGDLQEALSKANKIKLAYEGDKRAVLEVSPEEIETIKRTCALFKAHGGTWISLDALGAMEE